MGLAVLAPTAAGKHRPPHSAAFVMAANYRTGDEPVPGYKLLEFLGRGGFGEVWRASGPGGVEVALKIIDKLDQKAGRKELKAIGLIKRIHHANLVPLLAFWVKDKQGGFIDLGDDHSPSESPAEIQRTSTGQQQPHELIIAMGLAEKSLFDRLEECHQQGQLGIPVEELVDYMDQAARGIDFLNYKKNIQHCDIKPQNILVVGGSVQVCDFGLAKAIGDIRQTSMTAGTIAYGAPEVFENRGPSPTTDQYSLAISYVELRTGKLPFDGTSVMAVLDAKRHGKLDLSELAEDERKVIAKATSINPAERYESLEKMVRHLRRALPRDDHEDSRTVRGSAAAIELVPGYRSVRRLDRFGAEETWEALAPDHRSVALWIRDLQNGRGAVDLDALALLAEVRHEQLAEMYSSWFLDYLDRVMPDALLTMPNPPPPAKVVVAARLVRGTLGQRLDDCCKHTGGGIPPQELLPYMRQLAGALDFLNFGQFPLGTRTVAIQHGNLRPTNFLIEGDRVRLGNFTSAMTIEGDKRPLSAEAVAGFSLNYSAPEALGGQLSRWSDQYSLAIAYVHMRTGKLPFDPNSSTTQLVSIHREGKLDLHILSEPERAVIARATAVDPTRRFPTSSEMVDELQKVCPSGPARPAPASRLAETMDSGEILRHSPATPLGQTMVAPRSEATVHSRQTLAEPPASETPRDDLVQTIRTPKGAPGRPPSLPGLPGDAAASRRAIIWGGGAVAAVVIGLAIAWGMGAFDRNNKVGSDDGNPIPPAPAPNPENPDAARLLAAIDADLQAEQFAAAAGKIEAAAGGTIPNDDLEKLRRRVRTAWSGSLSKKFTLAKSRPASSPTRADDARQLLALCGEFEKFYADDPDVKSIKTAARELIPVDPAVQIAQLLDEADGLLKRSDAIAAWSNYDEAVALLGKHSSPPLLSRALLGRARASAQKEPPMWDAAQKDLSALTTVGGLTAEQGIYARVLEALAAGALAKKDDDLPAVEQLLAAADFPAAAQWEKLDSFEHDGFVSLRKRLEIWKGGSEFEKILAEVAAALQPPATPATIAAKAAALRGKLDQAAAGAKNDAAKTTRLLALRVALVLYDADSTTAAKALPQFDTLVKNEPPYAPELAAALAHYGAAGGERLDAAAARLEALWKVTPPAPVKRRPLAPAYAAVLAKRLLALREVLGTAASFKSLGLVVGEAEALNAMQLSPKPLIPPGLLTATRVEGLLLGGGDFKDAPPKAAETIAQWAQGDPREAAYASFVRALILLQEAALTLDAAPAAEAVVAAYQGEVPAVLRHPLRRGWGTQILALAAAQTRVGSDNDLDKEPYTAENAARVASWLGLAESKLLQPPLETSVAGEVNRRLAEHKTSLTEIPLQLASALYFKQTPGAPNPGELDRALTLVRGVNQNNASPRLLLLQADLARARGDAAAAIPSYAALIERLDSGQMKAKVDSLALYKKVIEPALTKPPEKPTAEIAPPLARLWAKKGELLLNVFAVEEYFQKQDAKNNPDLAAYEAYGQAVRLDPTQAAYFVGQGSALLERTDLKIRDKLAELRSLSDKAVSLSDKLASARGLRSKVRIFESRLPGTPASDKPTLLASAIDDLKLALTKQKEAGDERAAYLVAIGTAHVELANYSPLDRKANLSEALKYGDEAAKIADRRRPEEAFHVLGNAREDFGWVLHERGNYSQAIKYFTAAVALPNQPLWATARSRYNRGRCYYKMVERGESTDRPGDLDLAVKDLTAAAADVKGPLEKAECWFWIGSAHSIAAVDAARAKQPSDAATQAAISAFARAATLAKDEPSYAATFELRRAQLLLESDRAEAEKVAARIIGDAAAPTTIKVEAVARIEAAMPNLADALVAYERRLPQFPAAGETTVPRARLLMLRSLRIALSTKRDDWNTSGALARAGLVEAASLLGETGDAALRADILLAQGTVEWNDFTVRREANAEAANRHLAEASRALQAGLRLQDDLLKTWMGRIRLAQVQSRLMKLPAETLNTLKVSPATKKELIAVGLDAVRPVLELPTLDKTSRDIAQGLVKELQDALAGG